MPVEEIELQLNNILNDQPALAADPWDSEPLMSFLDNAETPVCFNSTAFRIMKNKVNRLQLQMKFYHRLNIFLDFLK